MQDAGHNMLHLHVVQQLPITLTSWTSELFPTNKKDAELNWQFAFGIDVKQNIAKLTQVKNEGREDWNKIFTINITSKGTVWR